MTLLALATPSTLLPDPQLNAGCLIGTGTALTGNTGFTVPWVPGLVIQITNGATATGAVTLVAPAGSAAPALTLTVGTSVTLLFGPVSLNYMTASTGLVQVNVTTVTTVSAAAFILAAPSGAKHSPFELNVQNADY